MFKHGFAKKHNQSRLYNIWQNMKQRCRNKKRHNAYLYADIKVCPEWENSFENFYNWAIHNGYSDELSIDRINGKLGYSPTNCRWATRQQQQSNLKNNFWVFYKGEVFYLSQLARTLNTSWSGLRYFLTKQDIKRYDDVTDLVEVYLKCKNQC